jgi:peptidoglycan L-alanyl-D-glutamate endopeptidase CwlK
MPRFSKRSLDNLAECHPDLRRVAAEAIQHFDFVVICGFRGEAEQLKAYHDGTSKARWLQSPHNFTPACAFDACPYPVKWDNTVAFLNMGEVMLESAYKVGVDITWGGHFKRFKDLPHFELTNWRNIVKG